MRFFSSFFNLCHNVSDLLLFWIVELSVVGQSEFTLNMVVLPFKVLAFLNKFYSWFDRHHFRWSNVVELDHSLLVG